MRALALCLLASSTFAASPPPDAGTKAGTLTPPALRLPPGTRARALGLELRVVPGEELFSGTTTLDFEADRPLDVLWLNATGLTPGALTLTAQGQPIEARAEVAGENFLAVRPARPIPAGPARLTLAYTGPLSRKNTGGLFQLKEGGLDYAFTHFEPLDARRAFPAFDEPQHKVPVTLTLHVKKDHLAFANTPQVSEADEPQGMKVVRFAPSQPLPTYLVAFAVGPFDFTEAGRFGSKKTPVRIIFPKGRAKDAAWAVASTGPILEQLEKYFGRPYAYEKLDQIAVPMFGGAMENPGLVTYGQQLILAKPKEETPGHQRAFASVCAHELAHQWFGDLVTMAWWDDLWLNEAFATWMAAKVMVAWKPQWRFDVGQVQNRAGALNADGYASARRVRQPIETNDDVANAFDGITYGKGASVIATFERWVGPDVFQKGVQRYLEAHAHGNATAKDFLDAQSQAAGKDVAGPMSTFLEQAGAPRVTFTLECPKDAAPTLALEQTRALPLGSTAAKDGVWSVPVCVRTSAKGKQSRACTLLDAPRGTLALEGKACPDWVLPNDGMLGHYRSNLKGAASFEALLRKAGPALSLPERIGVLGDVSALVSAGEAELSTALALVPEAAASKDRQLVELAMGFSRWPGEDFLPEAQRPAYQAFLKKQFGARAEKLGFTPGAKDSEDDRLLRPSLLWLLGTEGRDAKLQAQALTLARAWLTDRSKVSADVVDVVLGLAAETGDHGLHDALMSAVKTETDRTDRGRMLGGLSNFRDPALVKEHLALVLDPALDPREAMRLVWGASGDARTRALALEYVTARWDALLEKLPDHAGAGLASVAGGRCDEKGVDETRAFFEGRSTRYRGGPRTLAATLERIGLCVAFRERQRPGTVAFFSAPAAR